MVRAEKQLLVHCPGSDKANLFLISAFRSPRSPFLDRSYLLRLLFGSMEKRNDPRKMADHKTASPLGNIPLDQILLTPDLPPAFPGQPELL